MNTILFFLKVFSFHMNIEVQESRMVILIEIERELFTS